LTDKKLADWTFFDHGERNAGGRDGIVCQKKAITFLEETRSQAFGTEGNPAIRYRIEEKKGRVVSVQRKGRGGSNPEWEVVFIWGGGGDSCPKRTTLCPGSTAL